MKKLFAIGLVLLLTLSCSIFKAEIKIENGSSMMIIVKIDNIYVASLLPKESYSDRYHLGPHEWYAYSIYGGYWGPEYFDLTRGGFYRRLIN